MIWCLCTAPAQDNVTLYVHPTLFVGISFFLFFVFRPYYFLRTYVICSAIFHLTTARTNSTFSSCYLRRGGTFPPAELSVPSEVPTYVPRYIVVPLFPVLMSHRPRITPTLRAQQRIAQFLLSFATPFPSVSLFYFANVLKGVCLFLCKGLHEKF